MKIYKITKNISFEAWLGREIAQHTKNYQHNVRNPSILLIQQWAEDTNPDLSKITILEALDKASKWKSVKGRKPLREDLNVYDLDKTNIIKTINANYLTFSERITPDNIFSLSINKDKANIGNAQYYQVFIKYRHKDEPPGDYHTVRLLTKDGQFFTAT